MNIVGIILDFIVSLIDMIILVAIGYKMYRFYSQYGFLERIEAKVEGRFLRSMIPLLTVKALIEDCKVISDREDDAMLAILYSVAALLSIAIVIRRRKEIFSDDEAVAVTDGDDTDSE